jgi:hypothetical protein
MYTITKVTGSFVRTSIHGLLQANEIRMFTYHFNHINKCAELLNPGLLKQDTKYWKILETLPEVVYNMEYMYIWACDRRKELQKQRKEENETFDQVITGFSSNFSV